jgi:hypothetical protein
MVADVLLDSTEAWCLLDRLNNLVTEETIDWQTEGF